MAPDAVLIVHNYYQQAGGEDAVFRGEMAMLEARGHRVATYTRRNEDVESMNALSRGAVSIWNARTYREVRTLIRQVQPAVVHVHNTLPLVSPAVYYAARAERVPVVQTLHNYRLVCPSATLFRDGHYCTDCVGKVVPWPGVAHACYRQSRAATAAVASLLASHRVARTWSRMIDAYIVLSDAMRDVFVRGGLPGDRMVVKPNFAPDDPGIGSRSGGYMLFVGRLADVKGVDTLISAWPRLGGRIPLKIVGDGPLRDVVSAASRHHPEIEWLGQQSHAEVQRLMREAYGLVFPSVWHEPFSVTLIEALSTGLPVIGSNVGCTLTVVQPGRTGLHFEAGNATSLAQTVDHAWSHPEDMHGMAGAARLEYEHTYTPESNYRQLIDIYHLARERSAQSGFR